MATGAWLELVLTPALGARYHPPMSPPLAELQRQVDLLEAEVPGWLAEDPDPAVFWPLFAGVADVIEDQAGEHGQEISERIHAIADAARAQLDAAG